MKKSITLFLATLSLAVFACPGGGHRGPDLSDEQKSCLQELIGAPGQGERPSREEMKAAFDKCGIERPERPERVEHTQED